MEEENQRIQEPASKFLLHGLDGHESEWTPGAGDGQAGLACCDSWDHKDLDTTERLNWTKLNRIQKYKEN